MEAINRQTWKQRMASYKRTPLSFLLLVLVTASALFTVCILAFLLIYILVKGIPYLTPSLFAWEYNSENVSLMPALINTILMTALSLVIAVPLGIFAAIYLGYSMGSAPITSYNYGAGNHSELKNMLKKSLSLIAITGVCLTLISEFFSHPLINIFVGYDADLFAMTLHGFRLYAFVFLINGFNIWASSFFTALNNGVVSGMIAFLRTLLFQIGCIMLLPLVLGLNGIWMGVVVAEMLTLIVTVYFLRSRKNVYHY